VDDAEGQQDTLAHAHWGGRSGIVTTLGVICIGILLRLVWRVPVPLTVFGAGLALLAGDVWLSRLRPQASKRRLERFTFLHHLFDICVVTFVIHQLGGTEWVGACLYLFVILHADIILPRTQRLVVTAACILAFVSSLLLAYQGLLPPSVLFRQRAVLERDPTYVAVIILLVGIGVLLMFSLTFGSFADMLRTKSDNLRDANARLHEAAERLRGHRDELEQAVERRTRDLQTALSHLRSTHQELKRLDQVKTNFLANVTHELRTPLTSIRSFAEILLKFPDEESANREEFLQIIATEADRLARLIEDVLDITKIESGHMDWSFSSVEVASLLSFCARSVGPLAAAKNLSLRLELPSALPPVRADRDRIAQVLNNLLANALKFTERGEITVGAAAGDEHVRVYVSDTGPGIPEAEREQIFEKFHQISNGLAAKPRGTGLGLAISAEIVASHGGRIWVDSAPGRGSTFHFTLPVDRMETPPPAPPRARRRVVLVADSDPAARGEHAGALEEAGYAVIEAGDGREALRLAAQRRPDLICIDLLTRDMSGLAVLRALRAGKDTSSIPVIIVSVMEDKEWALQLGAACHLVKPVAATDLVAAAAQALAASARRAAREAPPVVSEARPFSALRAGSEPAE
jgi:signal transduction histidine kinase/CheY-like chemotaxis protein